MLRRFFLPVFLGELVVLAIYSVLLFTLGEKAGYENVSFVIGYASSILLVPGSGLLLLLVDKKKGHDTSINEVLFFYPAFLVTFLLSLGLSLLFYFLRPESVTASVIVYVCLWIVYAAYLFLVTCIVLVQAKRREHIRGKVIAIRELVAELDAIKSRCTDAGVSALLTKLGEDVRFSDPMSGEDLRSLDERLGQLCESIGNAIAEKDFAGAEKLIAEMSRTLEKRNALCKARK